MHKDNVHSFCRGDSLTARLYEPIDSMTDYVKKNGLDTCKCGWGTDHEIRAFATMLQIDVCTYSYSGSSRVWMKFPPSFLTSTACPSQTTRSNLLIIICDIVFRMDLPVK